MSPRFAATSLAATWTASLVVLAILWVRSPFLGLTVMFVSWSIPAAALFAVSWLWLRGQDIPQIPLSPWLLGVIVVAWMGALVLAVTDVGGLMALDGLVMRRPTLRWTGKLLGWLPPVVGLLVSVAGLSAGLEARYRIVHEES